MDVLKKQRASAKGSITRAQTFIATSSDDSTREALISRLKLLQNAWSDYRRIHNLILELIDDSELDDVEADYEQVEIKYVESEAKINELVNKLNVVGLATTNHTRATTADVKLPRIELPVFSGNFLEWSAFRDLFKSMIHDNQTISASQKLHYLKSALTDEASDLLQSIEITEANYAEAWGLLQERYQNERQLIQCHIKAFMNYQALSEESPTGIRKLLDNTNKHIRALNALGIETKNWDHILVFIVTEKLDGETRRQWELFSPGKAYPVFSDLKAYLEQRCRALEASIVKPKPKPVNLAAAKNYNNRSNPKQYKSSYHATSVSKGDICVICNGEHYIYHCGDLAKLNDKDKLATVKKHALCFNCLRNNHTSQQCKSESRCRKCGSKHHTLLHLSKPAPQPRQETTCLEQTSTVLNNFSGNIGMQSVLLSTAIVRVTDCTGQQQQCRAILDSGSQASLISDECVQRLGLKRSKANVSIIGIGQSGSGMARGLVNLHVSSTTSEFSIEVGALILNKLTGLTPDKLIASEHWTHLLNLRLADPTFGKPGKVDMILGADVFGELLMEGKIVGPENTPSTFNTKLGWVISGKISCNSQSRVMVNFANIEIQEQLKGFWELEELVPKKHLTPEEEACEAHFRDTYTRDSTGKFQVKLPFKEASKPLGYSKEIAVRRLKQVTNRLNKHYEYGEQYAEFLQQYLDLGHMESIPFSQREEILEKTNYLPHHFILKESTTTRLRVVFDASAKTSNETSLNDKLMVGPRLQDDIWDILLRFRIHKYAFTADIAMMYRQIAVRPEDADLQRIVWRKSVEEPLQEFRLTTVAYGTAAAPYLATKVLQQLAHEEKEQFPLAYEITMRDFYVDDVMSGAASTSVALEMQSQLITMMDSGGFMLRKWSSNEPALLESLPEDLRETKLPLEIGSDDTIKALGLHWHPAGDYLFFVVKLADIVNVNKRTILSDVARLYDPLGWLAPVIILAKSFIQRLWTAGVSWDEPLPLKLESEWLKFRSQLHKLQDLQIRRCIVGQENSSFQLHGFCDASELAYGAVVYLRSQNDDGTVGTNLICAKTRVAPLKQVSLPRLELCSAVLLARLMAKVKSAIILKIDSIYAWTDSTITLSWIAGLPRNWKTFVANRVAEIQELVPPSNWRHVSTLENPADAASRGLNPSELQTDTQWWNGPSWLSSVEVEWPSANKTTSYDYTCVPEQRIIKTLAATISPVWNLSLRFSSLTRLMRVTAYCRRFLRNARLPQAQRMSGVLTTNELYEAILVCIKSAQQEAFGEIVEDIKTGNTKISHLRSLNPFVDESGLVRVGGRLQHAKCSYDQRFPILLPKKHKLTELIVTHAHVSQLHAGPQATLATLHQKYWIVNGRSVVRHYLHKCHKCFRDRATTLQQQMGNLPANRLEPVRPFLRCGVDYAGPFTLKSRKGRGGQLTKAYIALFICFATKAVHLELVSDLSTNAFLAALKRFMARRGRCLEIHSDNGTNFVGANHELKELHQQFISQQHNKEVAEFLSGQGTSWSFIPAKAPHFGGLWEAGIKSMKTHLRRVVGASVLTYEELYTFLTQVEACLNSRPLCPISSDPSDLDVLTPGHFLIGEAVTTNPEPNLTELKLNHLDRWQLVQRLYQHFWNRWQREYLTQLQQRNKWTSKRVNIQKDDLVLLKEDHIPPLQWVKGRVIEVHPGKDNIVRVVSVKTATGVHRRPIVKLCLLPM